MCLEHADPRTAPSERRRLPVACKPHPTRSWPFIFSVCCGIKNYFCWKVRQNSLPACGAEPSKQSPLQTWAAVGPQTPPRGPPPRSRAAATNSAESGLHCPPQPAPGLRSRTLLRAACTALRSPARFSRASDLSRHHHHRFSLCPLSLTLAHPSEVTCNAGGSEPAALGEDQTLPGGSVTRFQNSSLFLPISHLGVFR